LPFLEFSQAPKAFGEILPNKKGIDLFACSLQPDGALSRRIHRVLKACHNRLIYMGFTMTLATKFTVVDFLPFPARFYLSDIAN
jgi:hypothetical protein